jgi:ribosomal protein S18 acetylase RimI-like enzyme
MPIAIREATPADAPALAEIVIESIQTAFRGLVPDQCLTWLTKEESAANWLRFMSADGRDEGEFLYVAEAQAGRVVGCALGRPHDDDPRYRGELGVLGVLPAYQGQGIGRRLVACVAERLAREGIHSLLVRVLMVNPHRGFYERLGGQLLREQPYVWNGVTLPEAVYGWTDTAVLMQPPCAELR